MMVDGWLMSGGCKIVNPVDSGGYLMLMIGGGCSLVDHWLWMFYDW